MTYLRMALYVVTAAAGAVVAGLKPNMTPSDWAAFVAGIVVAAGTAAKAYFDQTHGAK